MRRIPTAQEMLEIATKEDFIRKLPRRKRRFVELYTLLLDPKKVAKEMRLSLTTIYKYMKDKRVQQAIEYQKEIISMRNQVTQDYYITKLKEIVEDKSVKASERISAIQLLAKITGHLADKTPDGAQIVIFKQEGLVPAQEDKTIDIQITKAE